MGAFVYMIVTATVSGSGRFANFNSTKFSHVDTAIDFWEAYTNAKDERWPWACFLTINIEDNTISVRKTWGEFPCS